MGFKNKRYALHFHGTIMSEKSCVALNFTKLKQKMRRALVQWNQGIYKENSDSGGYLAKYWAGRGAN